MLIHEKLLYQIPYAAQAHLSYNLYEIIQKLFIVRVYNYLCNSNCQRWIFQRIITTEIKAINSLLNMLRFLYRARNIAKKVLIPCPTGMTTVIRRATFRD